jgi:D-3-phosphoglycerate dehydrogenase
MNNNLIFVALSTFSEKDNSPLNLLKSSGINYKIHKSGKRITKQELLDDALDATIIIAGVEIYDKELLSKLINLKYIVRCGVGIDNIDLDYAKEKGIKILNTPDVPSIAVAELALSMFLTLSRNLIVQANLMADKKWVRVESHLLSNKSLGIFGYGRIGKKVIELCKPFGLNIYVCDPYYNSEITVDGNIKFVSKSELLEKSDIISIHASNNTPGSYLIDDSDFHLMKKGALVVNLSRGGMINEEALYAALNTGQIAGAGLDVFEKEPYDGKLCELQNVILTPHSATSTLETRTAMENECVEKSIMAAAQNI